MIHKILLWICGIASILGIVLYLIDKTTNKEISLKLTLGLIVGGILAAIILALTEPKETTIEQPLKNIEVKENTNSPIANNIENQTNNYFQNDKESKETIPPLEKKKTIENEAESSGQKDGITANKVTKGKQSKGGDEQKGNVKNTVKSINQQGGITANEVNIYNEKPPLPAKELITETLNSINPIILAKYKEGMNPICVMAQQHKINKLLERENELKTEGLITIKSNGSVMMGNSNRMGNCINDNQDGTLNGFVIHFLSKY